MSMLTPLHRLALTAATITSCIALADAVTAATTGHFSVFADDSGNTAAVLATSFVHGFTYAALAAVLLQQARHFAGYGRVVRGARVVLVAALALLAVAFLVVSPILRLTVAAGGEPVAWAVVANVAFAGMILSTLTVSLAVLRRNLLGLGGRVLRLLLPVVGLTVLLGVVGSPWAHPAYVETVINVGLALVGAGVGASVGQRDLEAAVVTR